MEQSGFQDLPDLALLKTTPHIGHARGRPNNGKIDRTVEKNFPPFGLTLPGGRNPPDEHEHAANAGGDVDRSPAAHRNRREDGGDVECARGHPQGR
jgi:hypothetical protein